MIAYLYALDALQAFVVFEDSEEARRATQKDRETFGEKFGDRYVRVYPTLDSDIPDMQAAVAQAQLQEQAQVCKFNAARTICGLLVGVSQTRRLREALAKPTLTPFHLPASFCRVLDAMVMEHTRIVL